jgi:hypothetical protein
MVKEVAAANLHQFMGVSICFDGDLTGGEPSTQTVIAPDTPLAAVKSRPYLSLWL